ncbi:hypothetical protein HG535_0A03270 [Zygotorulaspora mrakii]|uniref:CCAAT-binding factor domain-containing protein n=1 Tax=Zygotorulaspora mrakii TaxID=42260 RepID=A0A7H9AVK0_ZYGMR|nr:uncharacterized protein HG535_0A03270 [Zygotorulaspora mrakii]QLG70388.1 hypothetical protein HG535_0A03270 [Zygotorulaspora mrakii]
MSGNPGLKSLKGMVSAKLQKNGKKSKKAKRSPRPERDLEAKLSTNDESDILHREAIELGATEEDIKLVKDLEDQDEEKLSEQEFGPSADEDEDTEFQDDLQSFLKTLGLEKTQVDIVSDTEVEEPDQKAVREEEGKPVEEDEDGESELIEASLSSDPNSEADPESSEAEVSEHEEPEDKPKEKKNSGFIAQNDMVDSDKLIISFDKVWYELPLDPQLERNMNDNDIELTAEQITKLYERGKETLEKDNETYYAEFTKESSQKKFMSQILTGGTLNDKISALTLLIQESPIHNIKSFETLLSFCNKKSRNSILQSVNALKDLFLNGLLPDRKLRYFKNQPGLSMMINKKSLAIFYFEDYLKKKFFQILEVFEKLSHDPIIHVRLQCLNHMYDLLSAKPEQEFNLLRLIVNKIGDIDAKVSSKASFLLSKLEQAHPNMKSVIIDAIVDVALKPNADYHTTYYSVITLNQTILKRAEDSVANKLIKTYFTLFEKFLLNTDADNVEDGNNEGNEKSAAQGYEARRKKNYKKGKKGGKSVKGDKTESELVSEKNSKLFSALLTGVNRAFPFAQLSAKVYEAHLETLFKITHSSNFNTSVQALVLINQVVSKAQLDNDRYYRTLYESLLDPRLISSSKQGIYLNLLHKSLKQDSQNVSRVEAFVKRILQVCAHWINMGTIAGFFYLLLQLVDFIPQIKNLLINTPTDYEYQSDDETTDKDNFKKREVYDSRKRDPKFANADKSSLWEINYFTNHFHPTIQLYSQAFIENKKDETTKPDLGLYTLAHFLDRFVYRNSKQKANVRGTSIMQPLYGGSKLESNLLVRSTDYVNKEIPANTENWLDKKVEDIKPDERFFYQYFTTKQNAMKKAQGTQQVSHDGSDLDEDDVWDALVKSRPDVEDDSGDEDGFNFDDEELDMSSGEEDPEEEIDAASEVEEQDSNSDDDEFFSFADEDDLEGSAKRLHAELEEGSSESVSEPESESESLQPHSASDSTSKSGGTKAHKLKNKKQRLGDLPLYGSIEDYAKYLDSDKED